MNRLVHYKLSRPNCSLKSAKLSHFGGFVDTTFVYGYKKTKRYWCERYRNLCLLDIKNVLFVVHIVRL